LESRGQRGRLTEVSPEANDSYVLVDTLDGLQDVERTVGTPVVHEYYLVARGNIPEGVTQTFVKFFQTLGLIEDGDDCRNLHFYTSHWEPPYFSRKARTPASPGSTWSHDLKTASLSGAMPSRV
jgi:hypothetical protein